MKTTNYQQCLLVKGSRTMVSWIPTQFADKKKKLCLKNDGEWEDGWMVLTQFGKKIDEDQLKILETQYRDTREASDV